MDGFAVIFGLCFLFHRGVEPASGVLIVQDRGVVLYHPGFFPRFHYPLVHLTQRNQTERRIFRKTLGQDLGRKIARDASLAVAHALPAQRSVGLARCGADDKCGLVVIVRELDFRLSEGGADFLGVLAAIANHYGLPELLAGCFECF